MWLHQVPDTTDDAALRAFVREGDASAFAVLVDRHAGRVYGTCLRILGRTDLAEEATQEVFFRLAKQRPSAMRALGAWLHRVATHVAIDMRRSEQRRRRRELEHAAMRPAEAVRWSDLAPHVDQALDALEEEDRTLLIGHFLERRSLRELARAWGTSVATLSRRLRGALRRLREQLERQGVTLTVAGGLALLRAGRAEAAPAGLREPLGKLAMVSGAAGSAGHAAAWAKAIAIALVLTATLVCAAAAVRWAAGLVAGPATPAQDIGYDRALNLVHRGLGS